MGVYAGGALTANAAALVLPTGTLTIGGGSVSLGSASTNVGTAAISSGVLSLGGGSVANVNVSGSASCQHQCGQRAQSKRRRQRPDQRRDRGFQCDGGRRHRWAYPAAW